MRTIVVLFSLAFFLGNGYGQNTFNIRDRYDFLACTLTSIVPTDSCYYATGIIADTLFPYRASAIFIKLDLNGMPIKISTVKNVDKTYEQWFNSLKEDGSGNFYNVGYSVDSIFKAFLVKYNPQGDTIFMKEYLRACLGI